jgi:hypothetical protein
MVRRHDPEAVAAPTRLGVVRVTTVEQTLVDLMERPGLDGMPAETISRFR